MKKKQLLTELTDEQCEKVIGGAHNVGPCNDSGESGNSDYAQHHIVPATLGSGAHIPGSHGGFSVCLGTGRVFNQP